MERWYTADLHFGHRKAVEFRPFDSVEQMDDALVALWNEIVAPGDEVWILGDLAMRPHDESLPHVARLHGRKVLVPGNHDECWQGQREVLPGDVITPQEARRRLAWQIEYRWVAGIDEIVDNPAPHRIEGQDVGLSHFPYTADHTGKVRFPEWRPTDVGGWLLHGHLHEMWRQSGQQINVGVDAWAHRPVHVDAIAEMIAAGPAELAPLPVLAAV